MRRGPIIPVLEPYKRDRRRARDARLHPMRRWITPRCRYQRHHRTAGALVSGPTWSPV